MIEEIDKALEAERSRAKIDAATPAVDRPLALQELVDKLDRAEEGAWHISQTHGLKAYRAWEYAGQINQRAQAKLAERLTERKVDSDFFVGKFRLGVANREEVLVALHLLDDLPEHYDPLDDFITPSDGANVAWAILLDTLYLAHTIPDRLRVAFSLDDESHTELFTTARTIYGESGREAVLNFLRDATWTLRIARSQS